MTFGVCGCVCEECRIYPGKCQGCHSIEGKACWLHEVGLEVCDFYECCVSEKGLNHCGECEQIPCEKFFRNKNPKWTDEQHREIILERVSMLRHNAEKNKG